MNCERKGCGHPLGLHDPCTGTTAKGRPCRCKAFTPADQKARAAAITDTAR